MITQTKFGIIDIGTNTIILLIVHLDEANNIVVDHYDSSLVRLGEGLHDTGLFNDQAIKRTLNGLKKFKEIIQKHNCHQTHIVATAACRKATNTNDFIKRVKDELDLTVNVISGEKEAGLTHKACQKDFDHLEYPLLVLDIGGGSTELIYDDGKTIDKTSFDFGVVTLTDKFIKTDPPTKNEIKQLRDFVQATIEPRITNHEPRTLIAPAGTPTTLCAISKELKNYDSNLVHGTKMNKETLKQLTHKLETLPLSQREKVNCLPAKRADVIIAGCHILDVVMTAFNLKDFHVSDHGLAFGVLYDLYDL